MLILVILKSHFIALKISENHLVYITMRLYLYLITLIIKSELKKQKQKNYECFNVDKNLEIS